MGLKIERRAAARVEGDGEVERLIRAFDFSQLRSASLCSFPAFSYNLFQIARQVLLNVFYGPFIVENAGLIPPGWNSNLWVLHATLQTTATERLLKTKRKKFRSPSNNPSLEDPWVSLLGSPLSEQRYGILNGRQSFLGLGIRR